MINSPRINTTRIFQGIKSLFFNLFRYLNLPKVTHIIIRLLLLGYNYITLLLIYHLLCSHIICDYVHVFFKFNFIYYVKDYYCIALAQKIWAIYKLSLV